MSTSNMETQCNGGVGYHRPDQYVQSGADLNEKENGYNRTNSDMCHNCDKDPEVGFLRKSRSQSESCQRKWTPREKYMLTICGLLFLACVAFILIAFIRDCHCHYHNLPLIHTVYNSRPDGHSSLSLTCNTSRAHPPADAITYRWLLPDGTSSVGEKLVIENVTSHHSGRYVCIVNKLIDGEEVSASSSTLVDASRYTLMGTPRFKQHYISPSN